MVLAAETLLAEGASAVDRTEAESSAEAAAKAPVALDPHLQGVWVYSQAGLLSDRSEQVRTFHGFESLLHSTREGLRQSQRN